MSTAVGTLCIVIVNWNSGAYLRECVASIASSAARLQAPQRLAGVVVVDNGSTDGSEQIEAPAGVPLQIVRNTVNRGFAAACNQGAAACQSEFLLFLNPDTRLFDDSLRLALAALVALHQPPVGIVGISLVDDSGHVAPTCSRFPRARHFIAQAFGLNRVWPATGQQMAEWDHRSTRVVDQVIGAFFLLRRSLFDGLGGFDERFFVYLEEVDLALRARAAGWASLHVAEARAYHRGGVSSDQVRARRLFYQQRSRLKYAAKHFGAFERAAVQGYVWVLDPLTRWAFAAARGARSERAEVIEAWQLLWADRQRGGRSASAGCVRSPP